jgi:hypothetical protein
MERMVTAGRKQRILKADSDYHQALTDFSI